MNVTSPAGITGTTPLSTLQSALSPPGVSPGADPPARSAHPVSAPQSLFEALAMRNDSDGDGLLSASEFDQAGVSEALPELFSKLDCDGNGLWSEAEMASDQDKLQGFAAEHTAATGSARSLYQSVIDALMQDESAETGAPASPRSRQGWAGQFPDLLSKIG